MHQSGFLVASNRNCQADLGKKKYLLQATEKLRKFLEGLLELV